MKQPVYTLLVALILVVCAGLTIGLTYLPCYSALCSENYYALETRIHTAFYYALIASIGLALLVRASWSPALYFSRTHLTEKPLPAWSGGHRLSMGGVLLATWVVGLTLATTGFWVSPAMEFWAERSSTWDPSTKIRLTVTTIIGHHADILLGLLLILVGRHSLIGRAFVLQQSTLLFAHKLLAYLTVVAAFAHGAAYYTFVGAYGAASDLQKEDFNVDNAAVTLAEAEHNPWYAACLPTGMFSFLLMLALIVTSLPALRQRHYNAFYYTHVIGASIAFIAVCIHANTDFYFLLPGLVLWIADWALRLFGWNENVGHVAEGNDVVGEKTKIGLTTKLDATLEDVGEGWYRITVPPIGRAGKLSEHTGASNEGAFSNVNNLEAGLWAPPYTSKQMTGQEVQQQSLHHPIQSYHINIPVVSKTQNHAFTAAQVPYKTICSSPSASDASSYNTTTTIAPIIFLFQRAQDQRKQAKNKIEKEWTWKVASLLASSSSSPSPATTSKTTTIQVHLEGPYSPNLIPSRPNPLSAFAPSATSPPPFEAASHIICVVAGTGITGALSLARWWRMRQNQPGGNKQQQQQQQNFTLIWTVRHRTTATSLREWAELKEWAAAIVDSAASAAAAAAQDETEKKTTRTSSSSSSSSLRLNLHVTSEKKKRLDPQAAIREALLLLPPVVTPANPCCSSSSSSSPPSAWVYVSGPPGLLDAGEEACLAIQREISDNNSRRHGREKEEEEGHGEKKKKKNGDVVVNIDHLDWYVARWEV